MGSVRVAIVGVGNCAASLVQGVEYYKNADPDERVPGLMHVQFGPYHVRDVQFVAAFDVDGKKVGQDLADAIGASEDNTIKFGDVPPGQPLLYLNSLGQVALALNLGDFARTHRIGFGPKWRIEIAPAAR